jgi:hypothetical protein
LVVPPLIPARALRALRAAGVKIQQAGA